MMIFFFFSSRRRHTRLQGDWSSDVCSSDLPPGQTIGQTIEALREMVKTAFITYIYVVDPAERLLGIVTMRDLLFGDNDKTLGGVMLRDVFALKATAPLEDAMRQVLDKHYPAYPVVDD